MNNEELKKYISPSPVLKIVLLILVVGLILSGVNIIKTNSSTQNNAIYYGANVKEGDYCYVDVVAVTHWIVKDDSTKYHCSFDNDGYWSTLVLSEKQFNSLSEQYDYMVNGTSEDAAPLPVRMKGIVKKINYDVEKNLAEQWDIDIDTYEYYFGKFYIDCTTDAKGYANQTNYAITIMLLIATIIVSLIYFTSNSKANKSLSVLEEKCELDRASNEFLMADRDKYKKQGCVITDNYIISRSGHFVVKISDIVWAFVRKQSVNFIPVSKAIIVNTLDLADLPVLSFGNSAKNDDQIDEFFMMLQSRNQNVMLGFDNNSGKVYRQMVKEHKENK